MASLAYARSVGVERRYLAHDNRGCLPDTLGALLALLAWFLLYVHVGVLLHLKLHLLLLDSLVVNALYLNLLQDVFSLTNSNLGL